MRLRKICILASLASFVCQVVLWASELTTDAQASVLSCPYNISVIGLGQTWASNGHKLNLALEYVRKQSNPEKVLLFADSRDTLFQGATDVCPPPDIYASNYWKQEGDVIFQADGGCGWATPEVCAEYGDHVKPFLNSGVVVASVEAMKTILETYLVPLQAMDTVPDHDQGFWHTIFGRQQKMIREGRPPAKLIAVDHSETVAGTSLTHSVRSASEVYEYEGYLSYAWKDVHHKIGCILHTPGQSANLIEKGIHMDLRNAFKSKFIANAKHNVRLSKALKLNRSRV